MLRERIVINFEYMREILTKIERVSKMREIKIKLREN
jgi:hypothetical protein